MVMPRNGFISSWLIFVISLTVHLASSVPVDVRTTTCEKHPYLSRKNSGVAEKYDPRDLKMTDHAPRCTLVFDFESSDNEMGKYFCESRHYGSYVNSQIDKAKKEIKCVYETYTYCSGSDISILGKCFRHKSTPKTLADAKRICEGEKMELPKYFDQAAMEWIYKLHDPNPSTFTPDVWMDSSVTAFPVSDRIEEEVSPSQTGSVLMFRYGPGQRRPGFYRAADPKEKHQYYCVGQARKFPAAFRRYCDVIRNDFKLPAAYHKSTCFVLSSSVYVPTYDKKKADVDNTHYSKACQFTEGMNSYAVAPTSRTQFDGMLKAVMSKFKNDGKSPRLVVPGKKTSKKQESFVTDCSQERKGPIDMVDNMFIYHGHDGHDYSVDTSGWDGSALKSSCADLHKDIITLAPFSGTRVRKMNYPFGDEGALSTYDYPRFFRGHVVCAAGFKLSDIYGTKCDDQTWKGLPRDEGKIMCHKPMLTIKGKYLPNVSKKQLLDECSSLGGEFLSPIESGREQKELVDWLKDEFKKANRSDYGSILVGMSTNSAYDFYLDYDKSSVYYTSWNGNEPNNYANQEFCVVLSLNPYEGRWVDIACYPAGYTKVWRIIAGVCAKFAN